MPLLLRPPLPVVPNRARVSHVLWFFAKEPATRRCKLADASPVNLHAEGTLPAEVQKGGCQPRRGFDQLKPGQGSAPAGHPLVEDRTQSHVCHSILLSLPEQEEQNLSQLLYGKICEASKCGRQKGAMLTEKRKQSEKAAQP